MVIPGLVGPSYRSQSPALDPERCVNSYVELSGSPGARVPAGSMPCPGFTPKVALEPGPIRCTFTTPSGQLFVVSGYQLYEVASDFTATNRGMVSLDSRPATITVNADQSQLFITSGGIGYCYVLATNVLTTVVASGCDMGWYLGNRFGYLDSAHNQWHASALNDATSWPGLLFAQRSVAPDPWVSAVVKDGKLWLFGSLTGPEVWAPDPSVSPLPFSWIQGALGTDGCGAPFSVQVCGSTLAWVAQNVNGTGTIVAANGYGSQKISDYGVDFAIQNYGDISDCVARSYQENGHDWIIWNFVNGGNSWCVDGKTGMWHERPFWNATTATEEACRVQTHARAFGFHIVGDRLTGTIYQQSDFIATDVDGSGMVRERIFRLLEKDQRWINYPRLQIDMQTGIGLQTGQGDDPQVMVQMSRDWGQTWDSARWVSAGRIGVYGARAIINRWGQARNAVLRVRVSDPVYPWAFLQCVADPDPIVGMS